MSCTCIQRIVFPHSFATLFTGKLELTAAGQVTWFQAAKTKPPGLYKLSSLFYPFFLNSHDGVQRRRKRRVVESIFWENGRFFS